jgi:uncharacterized protein (UPF0261 family)
VAGRGVIAVVATLDTKGREAAFLRDWFAARGWAARLLDVGTLGRPQCDMAGEDLSRAQVAGAAGVTVDALQVMRRDDAMAAMGGGAGAILRRWAADGLLAGAIGLGGNQGTAVACMALRSLPLGLPKVVVSTVASGNIRPYVGSSDIAMVFSLADLLGGPNRVTRGVLERAAGMLVGMVEATADATATAGGAPAVALTALGNTHAAASRIMDGLQGYGFEVVPFHASGAGGSAMESLVAGGAFAGVVDLTTHELLGELFGDDIYAPVNAPRLVAAGRKGLPQVVAPGGLDYFIFGPPESVPPRYRGRPVHHHNPYNLNVRAAAEELTRVGQTLADRLNDAQGPTAFIYPMRGWSEIGREGRVMWDPDANEALRSALQAGLRRDRVRYREVDANINDAVFADEVVRVFLDLARTPV